MASSATPNQRPQSARGVRNDDPSQSAADEDKENNAVYREKHSFAELNPDNNLENDPLQPMCTPKRSTLGRLVELFSPVKSGFSSEVIRLKEQYQECERERRKLADALRLQKQNYERQRMDLLNSHRDEVDSLKAELSAAQTCISVFKQQQIVLDDFFQSMSKNAEPLSEHADMNDSCCNALPSVSVPDIRNKYFRLLHRNDRIITRQSDLIDRLSSIVAQAESDIYDLRHHVFDLEASLEQEQHQNADYQRCIQMMEDEILELQVQRDQALDELKKCSSVPDLELAKAEAELIATECMVELAGAGESLDQATNTIVALKNDLSDMHSHIKSLAIHADNLEQQITKLTRESELWSFRYHELFEGSETMMHQIRSELYCCQTDPLKQVLAQEIEKSFKLRTLFSNSENSLKLSDQIRASLQDEILNYQASLSKITNYTLTMQSLLDFALQDAEVLVDYNLSNTSQI